MTEEILQQIKNPQDRFAACASRQGCPHKKECLRALVWEHCERDTMLVLNKEVCRFHPLRTEERVRAFPAGLRDMMKFSEYRDFLHVCLRRIGKTAFYRIRNGHVIPTHEQRRAIEQEWAKRSEEPFPWVRQWQQIVWS